MGKIIPLIKVEPLDTNLRGAEAPYEDRFSGEKLCNIHENGQKVNVYFPGNGVAHIVPMEKSYARISEDITAMFNYLQENNEEFRGPLEIDLGNGESINLQKRTTISFSEVEEKHLRNRLYGFTPVNPGNTTGKDSINEFIEYQRDHREN